MRPYRALALGASALVLLGACTTGGSKATIKIGSDGFYESKVVAEIYAQGLEANGYKVERSLGLGSRKVTSPAIESGQIDLKPEYIGSGLGFYDKTKTTGDPAKNAQALQEVLKPKGITVLAYSPGQDTNAFAIRKETADQLKLAKMSDLAAVADQLAWGLPPECSTNPLCGGALKDAYGVDVTKLNVKPLAACDAPIAEALQNKAVDVAELCSTQPAIGQFGFVVLEDDKQTQPAENLAPIVRDDYLSKVDKAAFEKILNDISAKLSTDELIKLGVEINVNNKDVADVAKEWLKANGFVK